jgi:ribosomal-protein-alanine N-acetyltransferase
MEQLQFSWITRNDLPEILRIVNRVFADPWTGEDFDRTFRIRNVIGLQCQNERERIRGYCVYELKKHTIELLSFAVDPNHHRQGIGTVMIGRMKFKLGVERKRLMLNVRESNLAGQLFFRAMGFRAINVVRQPFENCPEDAYRFSFRAQVPAVATAG